VNCDAGHPTRRGGERRPITNNRKVISDMVTIEKRPAEADDLIGKSKGEWAGLRAGGTWWCLANVIVWVRN